MTTAVLVASALGGVDARYAWTWAWAGDLVGESSWPALAGGTAATLTRSGQTFIAQPTQDLGALGAGSARIDRAVIGGTSGRYLAAGYPNPVAAPVHVRLVFRDERATGTATYLELSQAAQRITIRRSGTDLQLIGNLGVHTDTVPLDAVSGAWCLLDVIAGPAGFTAYLNGVDLTPLLTPVALAAFAGAPSVALLNDVAGTDAAINAEVVFAGLWTSPTLTLAQHRADAYLLAAQLDGAATYGEVLGFDWSWSPSRVDELEDGSDLWTLPVDPDATDSGGTLNVTDAEASGATAPLRPEGLGIELVGHALVVTAAGGGAEVASPSTADAIDGDLHVRLVFRVDTDAAAGAQVLFTMADGTDPTKVLEVAVDPANGDLTVTAPSGYTLTEAAAVALDRWHLLDLSLDRDGAGGNALLVAQLDGVDLGLAGHGAVVDDIPEGFSVTLLDGAEVSRLAFAGLARGRVLALDAHRFAAAALGVL